MESKMLKYVIGLLLAVTCAQGNAQANAQTNALANAQANGINPPLTVADMDCANGMMVPLEAVQKIVCELKGRGNCIHDKIPEIGFDEAYYEALKVCLSSGQPPKDTLSKK